MYVVDFANQIYCFYIKIEYLNTNENRYLKNVLEILRKTIFKYNTRNRKKLIKQFV